MEVNLNIEEKDIHFIKEYLKGKTDPVDIETITYELALFKTEEKRKNPVKIYNPNCEYKVGDYIFKEYSGKLPIGSKKYMEMQAGVVLKVIEVKSKFDIDEIKLSYEGTADFKKYVNYLEKQKIELLLPHKQSKPCEKSEYISAEIDPRKKQAPLLDKDFNLLRKKITSIFHKDTDIAFNADKILLRENLKPIAADVFDKIKQFLQEHKKSETTEFFVENFIRIMPKDKEFSAYCFSLNEKMHHDYKIDFQQTHTHGWGKWNLISVLYHLKKDSIISQENPLLANIVFNAKKTIPQRRKAFEELLFDKEANRYLLTQREITAGALRIKPNLYSFSDNIEIEATDEISKKKYTLYYYPEANLLMGLKDIYEHYRAIQGTILTFQQIDNDRFTFNIRTTKKGTVTNRIQYEVEKKSFVATDEKIASPVFVYKTIFLESDTINRVSENIDEYRKLTSINKLVHKVFLEFGIKEKNYEIHILHLYHILDLIYPIELKWVEEVLLGNGEFIPADKTPGVFYLDSDAVIHIEDEERKRREILIKEALKRKEEIRKEKISREFQLKEEIRLKREDRRRKREEEMWVKERLKKESEDTRIKRSEQEMEESKAASQVRKPAKERRYPAREKYQPREILTDMPEKTGFARKPAFSNIKEEFPMEKLGTASKEFPKKKIKKIEEEKPIKEKKKISKKVVEEKIDLDEIKKEIQLEELKEQLLDKGKKSEKETVTDKEIAYKDSEPITGIFASKLDALVEKDKDKNKKKKSHKST